MRRAGTLFLLAALPVCAQFGKPKVTAVASIDQPRFSSDIIRSLERDFDRKPAVCIFPAMGWSLPPNWI